MLKRLQATHQLYLLFLFVCLFLVIYLNFKDFFTRVSVQLVGFYRLFGLSWLISTVGSVPPTGEHG